MADEKARLAQYEYKANANLVLQADRSLITRISRDEATGEVVSLRGKLDGMKMGDRARDSDKAELKERQAKRAKKEQTLQQSLGQSNTIISLKDKLKGNASSNGLALSAGKLQVDQFAGLTYRPKTRETMGTYELILSFVQEKLGGQPRDVLCGAADEVC